MRVLVTGGAGFIGSHLVDALLEAGHNVRVMDILATPTHERSVRPNYLPAEAELIVADVRSKEGWERALRNVDAVFHLAACQGYLPDYSKFFSVNTVGTALLFESIAEENLDINKVVIASSQAVYGEGPYQCLAHGPFVPSARSQERLSVGLWDHVCSTCGGPVTNMPATEGVTNPESQYAMSKYTQEMIGLNLGRRHSIPVVVLRYSITLGGRQSAHNGYSGTLRIFATRMRLGLSPVIFEDGQMRRDYVHVKDVVHATLCAFEHPDAMYRVFNVGTGQPTSVTQLYEELVKHAENVKPPEIPGFYRVGDVRHIVSSPAALQALGWVPTRSLTDMVQDYLEYMDGIADLTPSTALQDMIARGVLRMAHLRRRHQ